MQSAHNTTRAPLLERFDASGDRNDPQILIPPSADWSDGHTIGFAEGKAHAAAQQSALSSEIAQTFADMGFGHAEARAQLLQGLKPLFGALINRILPGLAETAFGTHVVSVLLGAAEQDSGAPLELSVHPARIDGLCALLPHAVGLPVMLIADPGMARDQALLQSGRSETLLDVGAILAGAQAALGAMYETTDERVNYG